MGVIAEIAISMYGPRGEHRSAHPVLVHLILGQYPFADAPLAVVVARAEFGIIAGLLEAVVQISVNEELDPFFDGNLVAADGPIDLGLFTGIEPVDIDVSPIATAEILLAGWSSSANVPSMIETLPSARSSFARRELASRLRALTEYFLSATSAPITGKP